VSAAVLIQRLVAERFGGQLRIGIGIHTGVVIAAPSAAAASWSSPSSATQSMSLPAWSNSPKRPGTQFFSPARPLMPSLLDHPRPPTGGFTR
jgi:hypothetical protein